jgi:hypothetical protein
VHHEPTTARHTEEDRMDSHLWYTHTIHQEAHDRLRHRTSTAPADRLVQHPPIVHVPHGSRLRLALSTLLIAAGTRLQPQAQPQRSTRIAHCIQH